MAAGIKVVLHTRRRGKKPAAIQRGVQTGITVHIFRRSLLEGVHGVALICSHRSNCVMNEKSLREKLKRCLFSHIAVTWPVAAWRESEVGRRFQVLYDDPKSTLCETYWHLNLQWRKIQFLPHQFQTKNVGWAVGQKVSPEVHPSNQHADSQLSCSSLQNISVIQVSLYQPGSDEHYWLKILRIEIFCSLHADWILDTNNKQLVFEVRYCLNIKLQIQLINLIACNTNFICSFLPALCFNYLCCTSNNKLARNLQSKRVIYFSTVSALSRTTIRHF